MGIGREVAETHTILIPTIQRRLKMFRAILEAFGDKLPNFYVDLSIKTNFYHRFAGKSKRFKKNQRKGL